MADRARDHDDAGDALDPELLYTKEFCIGESGAAMELSRPRSNEKP